MVNTIYRCTYCNTTIKKPSTPIGLCGCGKPFYTHYEWEGVLRNVLIDKKNETLWRYKSVLPEKCLKEKISLGEGWTPLISITKNVFVKNETMNPTGSFKDRGMAVAITMAKIQNVKKVCLPSAGNAGVSASAYCQAAGIECFVYLPETIPEPFINETKRYNAQLVLKGKTISEAAKTMNNQKLDDWFDISTLKEPFRVEGKKTLGYEIAEQMNWELPDAIIYPTGGGTGIVGMWKAFDELEQLGWIDSKRPKMFCVQSSGCAPIVKAFVEKTEFAEPWQNAKTIASGLRVPVAIGDYLILDALRSSNGGAVSVDDEDILLETKLIAELEGMFICPEGGATIKGLKILLDNGQLSTDDNILLLNTGTGLKYLDIFKN